MIFRLNVGLHVFQTVCLRAIEPDTQRHALGVHGCRKRYAGQAMEYHASVSAWFPGNLIRAFSRNMSGSRNEGMTDGARQNES